MADAPASLVAAPHLQRTTGQQDPVVSCLCWSSAGPRSSAANGPGFDRLCENSAVIQEGTVYTVCGSGVRYARVP